MVAASMEAEAPMELDAPQVSLSNNHVQDFKSADGAKFNPNFSKNALIDLDMYDDECILDKDCIFIKTQKNSMPKGSHKQTPICVDVDDYFNQAKKLGKMPKVEQNFGKEIGSASVQCVDDYDDENDEIRVISVKLEPSPSPKLSTKTKKLFRGHSVFEVGESSSWGSKSTKTKTLSVVPTLSGSKSRFENVQVEVVDIPPDPDPDPSLRRVFTCEICADSKPLYESFKIEGCDHSYCSACVKNYVDSKLQNGISQINCPVPGCRGLLDPEYCREILTSEIFDRWGELLCQSVMLASQKFYCPFKDCSTLLLDDGTEVVTQSECPSCFRLFCAQCKVAWHDGIQCAEYQKLSEDERATEDIMFRNLANQKLWQRCPNCKIYVEKIEGCLFMKCRCGIAFCYSCGAAYSNYAIHYCTYCHR